MARSLSTLTALALSSALVGCMVPASGGDGFVDKEAWNERNDPGRFDGELEYRLDALPREGRAEHAAWPSTYWPTYEDGINDRWLAPSELSPAEKYDMAFNGWTPDPEFMALRPFDRNAPVPDVDWDPEYYDGLGPLARHVSEEKGNRRDREAALSNDGAPTDEWGVETWWGLCHQWAPASMLEGRPERAVTYNGVRFEVADIEGLLIAAYEGSRYTMLGGRCESSDVARDERGRAIDSGCRDTNPGSFHVIMANFLGLRGQSIAEDRTYDYEVWNQPVVAFDVTRMEEIDVAKANELLNVDGVEYDYNDDAVQLFEVHASATYVTESHPSTTPAPSSDYEKRDYYTYILEVDADGHVIGGEWFGDSLYNQPDFLWMPQRAERSGLPNLDLDDVRMLVEMSRGADSSAAPEPVEDPSEPEEPTTREEPTTGGQRFVGDGMIAIPDNYATGIYSFARVPAGTSGRSVEVHVDISHSYVGDLYVTLTSPSGDRWTLHDREGGDARDIVRTFPIDGVSSGSLAGTWQLAVSDHADADVGTLNAWELIVR